MSDRDDDDYVGYRRPPRHGQFRKGQSGNPRGRPRKSKEAKLLIERSELDELQRVVLDQEISVTEGGRKRTRKAIDVVMRSQTAQAMKGHTVAQRDVLRRSQELEARDARREANARQREKDEAQERIQAGRDTFRHMVEFKAKRQKEWDEALAQGREEPDFPWPHPDDILLDRSREQWHVRGPFDASGVSLYRWIMAERNLAFTQMVLDARARSTPKNAWLEFWSLIWNSHDVILPLRWQVGERYDRELFGHMIAPMRDLREAHEENRRSAEKWKRLSGNDRRDKDTYRIVNGIMAPILAKGGYKSLAQFERAADEHGGEPPWSRLE